MLASAFGYAVAAAVGIAIAIRLMRGAERFADGPAAMRPPTFGLILAAAVAGCVAGTHDASPRAIVAAALLVAALAGCCWSDMAFGLVPDLLTIVPLGCVAIAAAIVRDPAPLVAAAFVGLPLALVAIVSRGRGLGWGDVKLLALAAAVVGVGSALVAAAVASFVAAFVALARRRRDEPIAFVPYLAATLVVAVSLPGSTP